MFSSTRTGVLQTLIAFTVAAAGIYTPAIAHGPDESESAEHTAKAADEAFRKQDWKAAAAGYESITKSEPKNGMAWYRLGFAYHNLREFDKAIPIHRKTAEFPRFRPVGLYNLGCALALKGDKDAAFKALDEAVEAGFSDASQLESDADLKSLRSDDRFEPLKRRANPIASLVTEFDFWVGDWDVFDPQGNQLGTNRIEKVENGCLILEHWSNMQGNTGQSINFIDPVDRKWKQVWVDGSGSVVRYDGEFKDGAMHFTGTHTPQRGQPALARGSLTPQKDGKVRHFIEHSDDNGKTWKPYFDGVYVKKSRTDQKPDADSSSN